MLNQLFSYKAWDDIELLLFHYYECTLNRDIGRFKKDDDIKQIMIDFEKGEMHFKLHDDTIEKFLLTLEAKPDVETHSSS